MTDTTTTPDAEVKNPAAVLAKNKELLAKNAELAARIGELELELAQAKETAGAAVKARDEAVFDHCAMAPFRRAIKSLGTAVPGLMERTILELCELRLDEDNKPYLVDKATGKEITTTEKVYQHRHIPGARDPRPKDAPPPEEKHTRIDPSDSASLARWIFDNESKVYPGVDNPFHLLPRPQGSGATGGTSAAFTNSTPAQAPEPPKKPQFGLR